MKNYIEINRKLWNRKTEVHLESDFYDVKNFIKGRNTLNEIELSLLPNLAGKSVLHLQCHFGQDTISLSKLGAEVTGIDLSDKAIDAAHELAIKTNSSGKFLCCDIYDLPQHLDKKFDMVFTSYGTIGWLPDMDRWAKVISHFLKPDGLFVFVEFHPVVWMFDNDFKEIAYNYFNMQEIIETESGTYADRDADIHLQSISWNHDMSEVINSLIKNGLSIQSLNEYNYSPYNCFNQMIEVAPNKFRIKHLEDKIPMVYSIVATKKQLI
jgi:SAM-dependent methyltransferase